VIAHENGDRRFHANVRTMVAAVRSARRRFRAPPIAAEIRRTPDRVTLRRDAVP